MLTEKPEVKYIRYMRSHNTGNIPTKKNNFSKTKIYFHTKTTPQILAHIGLQNMKVGVKSNFGRLAKILQICSIDV